MTGVIGLTRFKLASYARSHRLLQPVIGLMAMLAIFYSSRAPAGQELIAYADSAGLLVVVFGWAARGLLDTEPPAQRLISLTSGNEVLAGLFAAATVNVGLAAVAVAAPLWFGFSAFPAAGALAWGALLHLVAALIGTALGALTSSTILPSPAVSILGLIGGYLALVLVSGSAAGRFAVPVLGWMRAARDAAPLPALTQLLVPAILWPAAALLVYARLRRTRP